ncbi:hypothetical protein [Caballeronia sp. ATUFL_M1_KS5A]|uniref:hypothetical protein n=1 Tax=Caballeronia sp. ATUFL_M1_KS5A TaxID=2921778 RepID=UPI0020293BB9|nr:hypothetical protein [Caballeronia sp. ATUFL_M1_KS5A]
MIPFEKHVAIVSFEQDERNAKMFAGLGHPVPRVVTYSVTMDPARLSPSGEFIRFGQWGDGMGQGDEITGWVRLSDVHVHEVIATWDGKQFVAIQHSAERAA